MQTAIKDATNSRVKFSVHSLFILFPLVIFYCFCGILTTVKILKFGTPQTIAIIVLKIEKFDVTLQ